MKTALTTNPEREGVIEWRRTQLLRSGFPTEVAVSVAENDRYDLHGVIGLVEHGCPPELALRILAPLEDESLDAVT